MTSKPRLLSLPSWVAALSIGLFASCGGGGGVTGSGAGSTGNGNFLVESSSLGDGVTWELNRLIEITFNNPVDPETVSFATVQFSSPETLQPVTGSFEFKPGSGNKVLYFRPSCPTNEANDNGAFVPGGIEYRLSIPKSTGFGSGVLRDQQGRALAQGFSRTFFSPKGSGSSLFVDYTNGPPAIDSDQGVRWPSGLNFFTDPDPLIQIHFNQAIDARSVNVNLDRIHVLFAKGEVGSADENVFPATNRLPGSLNVEENCSQSGSMVSFRVSGLLPPNRKLRLVIESTFTDIAGQANLGRLQVPDFTTPSLADYYNDSNTDWSTTEVADEFQEFFEDTSGIDLETPTSLPLADIEDGFVQASFDFPGQFTNKDFIFDTGFSEIFTNSQTFFTDSRNTTFTVVNGVVYCHDLVIAAGSELRGRGNNPLVFYATGKVTIDGTLNVSGNNAEWPTGLNSAQRPEGGAKGECGGGNGGTSSQEVFRETVRGSSGDGPFGLFGNGGQGGESGLQQNTNLGTDFSRAENANLLVGGGGGGTFALTPNVSVFWTRFRQKDSMENVDQKFTPDHAWDYHTATDPQLPGERHPYFVLGGEDGVRGTSFDCQRLNGGNMSLPHGVYGMEDLSVDIILDPDGNSADGYTNGSTKIYRYNRAWTIASDPNPYQEGHPTRGPDPGKAGPSVFSNDGDSSNDFWGNRLNNDGTVTKGELLSPWAGSGGGASGDSVEYIRGNGGNDLVTESYPSDNFPTGTISAYRKGGPGGGGGGQLMILAIGMIKIGADGLILANGGHGIGAESSGYTYGTLSGSGGGSGGHIVLHSATGLDLSAIDITDGSEAGDQNFTLEDGTFKQLPVAGTYMTEVIRAIGGRRGQSGARNNLVLTHTLNQDYDGNDTYAIGRGGAGGNGLIQIHVPDPATDILWPSSKSGAIRNFIHNGDVDNNPVDRDRLESLMRMFAAPQPVVLVPMFSSQSMYMSKWVDTGLAELRQPNTGLGVDYPDYRSGVISLLGFDPSDGTIDVVNERIPEMPKVISGATASLRLFEFEGQIVHASSVFVGKEHLLRQPRLLRGYDFRPNETSSLTYGIVDASYDLATDTLTLLSDPVDGSMEFAAGGASWSIIPRFFRLATSGLRDSVPATAEVVIEFQGAEESAPGSNEPGVPVPDPTTWTSDLNELQGLRFLRYRVRFEIDAQGTGVDLSNPRPVLEYLKLPFTW